MHVHLHQRHLDWLELSVPSISSQHHSAISVRKQRLLHLVSVQLKQIWMAVSSIHFIAEVLLRDLMGSSY